MKKRAILPLKRPVFSSLAQKSPTHNPTTDPTNTPTTTPTNHPTKHPTPITKSPNQKTWYNEINTHEEKDNTTMTTTIYAQDIQPIITQENVTIKGTADTPTTITKFNTIHVSEGTIRAYNLGQTTSTIHAYGNATIHAYGNIQIYATDTTRIYAHNGTSVVADQNANITIYNSGICVAGGNATVRAFDNTSISGWGVATINAYNNANINTVDMVTVNAYNESEVIARGSCTLHVHDAARVSAYGTTSVELYNGFVYADHSTTVTHHKNTDPVIADDGSYAFLEEGVHVAGVKLLSDSATLVKDGEIEKPQHVAEVLRQPDSELQSQIEEAERKKREGFTEPDYDSFTGKSEEDFNVYIDSLQGINIVPETVDDETYEAEENLSTSYDAQEENSITEQGGEDAIGTETPTNAEVENSTDEQTPQAENETQTTTNKTNEETNYTTSELNPHTPLYPQSNEEIPYEKAQEQLESVGWNVVTQPTGSLQPFTQTYDAKVTQQEITNALTPNKDTDEQEQTQEEQKEETQQEKPQTSFLDLGDDEDFNPDDYDFDTLIT